MISCARCNAIINEGSEVWVQRKNSPEKVALCPKCVSELRQKQKPQVVSAPLSPSSHVSTTTTTNQAITHSATPVRTSAQSGLFRDPLIVTLVAVVGLLVCLLAAFIIFRNNRPAANTGDTSTVEGFFAHFVALEQAYDPAVGDLYADSATIYITRVYFDGSTENLSLSAKNYKEAIIVMMSLAELAGDSSEYSDLTFTQEGENVRIAATRYSVLKDKSGPYEMLIGPDGQGGWLILEEFSVTYR